MLLVKFRQWRRKYLCTKLMFKKLKMLKELRTVRCPVCGCDLTEKYQKAYDGYDVEGITIIQVTEDTIKVEVDCPNCGFHFMFYDYRKGKV